MARTYRHSGAEPDDPFRYLLAAVLHQALLDVRSRKHRVQRDALVWLRESAVDVCELLGVSIEDWRELL